MPHQLEITLKQFLPDAEGESIRQKAAHYFGIRIDRIRTVHVITIDRDLTEQQRERIGQEVFTNPVTQDSSWVPLDPSFDWCIWVGFRPGVRDNPGATAVEAISDVLGVRFGPGEAVYTSKRYCVTGGNLTEADMHRVAGELLANDIIQQWRISSRAAWNPETGFGHIIPKVRLDHTPTVTTLAVESDAVLQALSDQRSLALNPNDIPVIRRYFAAAPVREMRKGVGLSDPTDVELEYLSQARSDHCNHNTFRGKFFYRDAETGEEAVEDNLFKTYIQKPTLALKDKKDWVVSVLWDNAGVGRFDEDHYYVITGETHNSPSNMEAYGGAITGIVGVYRDPLGTGKGARLIMGSYGYCVGPRDYAGPLLPRLHPRRLLDGVVEGVRDGGNKSGIPTPFGQITFHPGYLGKCLVFVTALGLMPAKVDDKPSEEKTTSPGDLMIMCGGRVGKDGIHGVTASSEVFSEHTPAGHVQIGDPYTQKKMHDFLLQARDEGLIQFITDNGGGGLSSSVGESAMLSGGCEVALEKVPLKYEGLDQWEIWVSESQERMTVAVRPDNLDRFMALSQLHAVESTVIGRYTDTGKLHITYAGKTCAYVDLDLLESGFPQWTFEAEWRTPQQRGLMEPVVKPPQKWGCLLLDMLSRPNICAKNWVARQYDHEVQGGSVVKPLVGKNRDVPADAVVIRPVLSSDKGLVFTQALLPFYAAIDAYHMTTCTIDEAVRRLVCTGADPSHIGGVDNFCWPSIQYDSQTNPDGRFKAAQLVRSCRALRDMCMAWEIPLLSGKDSMYVDGHLAGPYGEFRKISALETLQFSATSLVADVAGCVSMDTKCEGDIVYLLGETRNELGASEYYALLGFIGTRVPQVDPERFFKRYRAVFAAVKKGLVASAHGVYRGGLAVHLAMTAMGGGFGLDIDLDAVPAVDAGGDDVLLFSESAGRILLTVDPKNQAAFENVMADLPLGKIGRVTGAGEALTIKGLGKKETEPPLINLPISELKAAWCAPFGELV